MTKVSLEKLSKVYASGVRAVDAVDLDVESGEFVVLVGPSGCGKSTTLRMVAGLEEISGGTLRIGDRVVNQVPARDRDIAMVFQSYALYPHLTVEENLAFGLQRRRRHRSTLRRVLSRGYRTAARAEDGEIRAQVARAAATLGIESLLQRKPGALSGGQRQRVAVGRALVREPKVFLFDEPLSNLDAKLRVEMRAEIKELHKKTGATMLYVTHDQEEAMTLGDQVVVMQAGEIQQAGPPREVYERPANMFVAGFLGTPEMNRIAGRIESGLFVSEPLQIPLPGLRGNREVVLGIRPEQLSLDPGVSPDELGFPARVEVVEMLGPVMHVYVAVEPGLRWVIRCAPQSVQAGDAVTVWLDSSRVHLFDRETGRSWR